MEEFFDKNPELFILNFEKLRAKIPKEVASNEELKTFLKERNNKFGKKYRPRVFFRIASQPYTWQVDLMFHKNRIFFVGIEINSRYAFAEQLPNNATGTVAEWLPCFTRLLELKKPTYKVICDDQFYVSSQCRKLCSDRYVKLHGVVSKDIHKYHGNKLGFVDRLVRTIKWYDLKLGSYKDANNREVLLGKRIETIVDTYNHSPHAYLTSHYGVRCENRRMRVYKHVCPADVVDDFSILTRIHTDNLQYNAALKDKLYSKFKVGYRVRCILPRDMRGIRSKENIMLSKEIYIIMAVNNTGYALADEKSPNVILDRLYKVSELQLAHPLKAEPDVAVRRTESEENEENVNEGTSSRPNTRQKKLQDSKQAFNTAARRAQDGIIVGTRMKVLFSIDGIDGKFGWYKGFITKVYKNKRVDKQGRILFVDIEFDDGEKKKNFKLFEDYYKKDNVESAWMIL